MIFPSIDGNPNDIERMNEAAWQASKAQLAECVNCGRRFQPDRLLAHQRSCKPGNEARRVSSLCYDLHFKKKAMILNFVFIFKVGAPVNSNYEADEGYYDGYDQQGAGYPPQHQHQQQQQQYPQQFQQQQQQPQQGRGAPQQQPHPQQRNNNNNNNNMPRGGGGGGGVNPVENMKVAGAGGRNPNAIYQTATDDSAGGLNLRPCPKCGRKFAAERLQAHVNVCGREKKRKVFDSTKHRVQGTEAEQYLRKKKPEPKTKPNNWRAKHQEFISAIRYAKMAGQVEKSGGSLANLPPPPMSTNPDYVACPHCGRKFNQMAADRHIPKCKDTVNKPKPPPGMRNAQPMMGKRNPVNFTSNSGFDDYNGGNGGGYGNGGGGGFGGGYSNGGGAPAPAPRRGGPPPQQQHHQQPPPPQQQRGGYRR